MKISIDIIKYKYYIIAILVGMANVLFSASPVMYFIVALEVIILLFKIFKMDYVGYLGYYTIFVCLSIEFDILVKSEQLYSLKNIRVFGINMGVWLLVPLLISYILNYKSIIVHIKDFRTLYDCGMNLMKINFIACIVGIISIALNDNGVNSLPNYISFYLDEIYSFFLQPFTLFWGISLALKNNNERISEIGIALHATLIGNISMMLTSVGTGISGQYGSVDLAITSMVSTMVCFLLLYPSMENTSHHPLNMFVGIIGVAMLLMYKQSGKLFLVLILVVIIYVRQNLKIKNTRQMLLSVSMMLILVLSIIYVLSYMQTANNVMFNSKIAQAKQILYFSQWNVNSIRTMSDSPRIRFGEIINVLQEYLNKPWFIITGKGFAGSVRDWSGILNLTSALDRTHSFTVQEYANGLFYNLHEISSIILDFGLLGIVFYFHTIGRTRKYLNRNLWMIIGLFWFPIYYGYSFTMGVYGIVCFYYGLLLCDKLIEEEKGPCVSRAVLWMYQL